MYTLTRGERFKDARTVYNKHGSQTMSVVQKATGVSASLIADLENDEKDRGASYLDIAKLARHYGVTTDWLCGLVNDHHEKPCALREIGLSEHSIYFLKSLNDVSMNFDAMLSHPSGDKIDNLTQKWNDAISEIKCLSGLKGYELRHYANLLAYYGLNLVDILISAIEENYSIIADFYDLRETDPKEWDDVDERISYNDFIRFKASEISKVIDRRLVQEFENHEAVYVDPVTCQIIGEEGGPNGNY